MPKIMSGYLEPKPFRSNDIEHFVYESRSEGPPVLLMHELPGLSENCRLLADQIAAAGFRVYMPLFFGQPESTAIFKNTIRVCISREFMAFASNKTQPLVLWLKDLVSHISKKDSVEKVGVIGMCLTGNFALTLISHTNVKASVCCQPSLPIFRDDSLAISPSDLQRSVDSAKELGKGGIIGFRYEKDTICPAIKFSMIKEMFGECFDEVEFSGKGHSTLTGERENPNTILSIERTIQYLKGKL